MGPPFACRPGGCVRAWRGRRDGLIVWKPSIERPIPHHDGHAPRLPAPYRDGPARVATASAAPAWGAGADERSVRTDAGVVNTARRCTA